MPARWMFAATLVVMSAATASAATIECSQLGSSYDSLFMDGKNRIEAIQAEYAALPASADAQRKETIRRRFCAVGGEVLGYYKLIRSVADDCAARGEKLDQLLDVIDKQQGLARKGLEAVCS